MRQRLQGRAARRQDDPNAARRASHAAASTSNASHSSRAAQGPAPGHAPKHAQAGGVPGQAGVPSISGSGRHSGLASGSSTQTAQGAEQCQMSLHPEVEATIARTLEYRTFGGPATSNSKPKSDLMKRYKQGALFNQRVEDERRGSAGASQQTSYVNDIMPDTPAGLQKLAAVAKVEVRQLQAVGAGQAGMRTPQLAGSAAGGFARPSAHAAADESGRSQGGSGGGSSSNSQSSWSQAGPPCRAEYSNNSSSQQGSAQVSTLRPELLIIYV